MVFVYNKLIKTGKPKTVAEDMVAVNKALDVSTQKVNKVKAKTPQRQRSQCDFCKVKVAVSAVIKCRCGMRLCHKHIFGTCHDCSYDYKREEMARAMQEMRAFGTLAQKVTKI